MVSKMSWKSWVVLGAAVALFVASGGLLMASNMGFKINKALSNGNVANSNKGVNWVSVPFNNPYTNYRGLCQAFETQFGQAVTPNVNVEEIDASTGAAVNQLCLGCCPAATPTVCGGAGANCNATLVRNAGLPGVRIRITGTTASSPTNIVLVGSSIETHVGQDLRGDPSRADLVARKHRPVHDHDIESCLPKLPGAGRPGRTAARDEHVTGVHFAPRVSR